MDNVTETPDVLPAVFREDGTLDLNATAAALLKGALNAMMDEQASELGVARNGYRERALVEEFLELVNYMNFTVAARKLNLTQSALSKHIAALEKEFDVVLVDRSKQQIELTQQGRIFC